MIQYEHGSNYITDHKNQRIGGFVLARAKVKNVKGQGHKLSLSIGIGELKKCVPQCS